MRDDDDQEVEEREGDTSAPVAGYAANSNTALDQRGHTSKHGRHNTRVLPTALVLRGEYRRLANDPKCGKRGAIAALARKYKVSQSAVRKALIKKERKV